jgi:hypothetical protein
MWKFDTSTFSFSSGWVGDDERDSNGSAGCCMYWTDDDPDEWGGTCNCTEGM